MTRLISFAFVFCVVTIQAQASKDNSTRLPQQRESIEFFTHPKFPFKIRLLPSPWHVSPSKETSSYTTVSFQSKDGADEIQITSQRLEKRQGLSFYKQQNSRQVWKKRIEMHQNAHLTSYSFATTSFPLVDSFRHTMEVMKGNISQKMLCYIFHQQRLIKICFGSEKRSFHSMELFLKTWIKTMQPVALAKSEQSVLVTSPPIEKISFRALQENWGLFLFGFGMLFFSFSVFIFLVFFKNKVLIPLFCYALTSGTFLFLVGYICVHTIDWNGASTDDVDTMAGSLVGLAIGIGLGMSLYNLVKPKTGKPAQHEKMKASAIESNLESTSSRI